MPCTTSIAINRNALVLRPTKEMIEWANSVFPEDPIDYQDMSQHDEQDVFLLPDFDSTEESLEWVKENCEDFLAFALEDWCMDRNAWPSPMDWALFERFFHYSIESSVIDTMNVQYDEGEEEETEGQEDISFGDN